MNRLLAMSVPDLVVLTIQLSAVIVLESAVGLLAWRWWRQKSNRVEYARRRARAIQ